MTTTTIKMVTVRDMGYDTMATLRADDLTGLSNVRVYGLGPFTETEWTKTEYRFTLKDMIKLILK